MPQTIYKLYTLSSKPSEVESDFNAFAEEGFAFVSFVPITGTPKAILKKTATDTVPNEYQYKIETSQVGTPVDYSADDLLVDLTHLSERGWELIAIIPSARQGLPLMVYKIPKQ